MHKILIFIWLNLGLKHLIEMCASQGLKEAEFYSAELKRVEKSKEARERIGSARPGVYFSKNTHILFSFFPLLLLTLLII